MNGSPNKDLGETEIETTTPQGALLLDEKQILAAVRERIRNEQVSAKRMEYAPPRVARKAVQKEHADNWADAHEAVSDEKAPKGG